MYVSWYLIYIILNINAVLSVYSGTPLNRTKPGPDKKFGLEGFPV